MAGDNAAGDWGWILGGVLILVLAGLVGLGWWLVRFIR
jgi:hypothetical protein